MRATSDIDEFIASFASSLSSNARALVCLVGLLCFFSVRCTGEELEVHRFQETPHLYYLSTPQDAFYRWLNRDSAGGAVRAASPVDEKDRLLEVLKALNIPVSSQLLVYSATSLQSGIINPANPVFYLLNTDAGSRISAVRSERCMNCHAGRTSWHLPGLVAESVIPTKTGASLDGFRREKVGHVIPLKERLGGWHVTGAHAEGPHLGNLMGESYEGSYTCVANPPGMRFHWERYPARTSDLFAHLIHEHQLGFHNLVTLALYRTRDALLSGGGMVRERDRPALQEAALNLVRYMLFQGEALLPSGGLTADAAFVRDFLGRRVAAPSGSSLRDLELKERLFRHRCSYMIYTPGFKALQPVMKETVLRSLQEALSERAPEEFGYLPASEKRAILHILRETGVIG